MVDVFQFVDAIGSSPTVLLDLNNRSPLFVVANGWSAPPPGQRISSSSSALTDGDFTASSTRGDREITVTVGMDVTTPDAAAAAIQSLARILDAGGQWLRFQPGTTAPVFFRTKRADIEQLEEFNNNAGGYKQATLTIPAEPFAYGLPESGTPIVTNDPTSGTNQAGFALPAIKGDVQSPLRIFTQPSYSVTTNSAALLIGSAQVASPIVMNTTGFVATSWTNSTPSSASAIGGTYTRFTSTGAVTSANPVGAGSASFSVLPGDYRVLARARTSGTGGVIAFAPRGVTLTDRGTQRPLTSAWRWLDLGTWRVPFAAQQASAFPPDNAVAATGQTVSLEMKATGATSTTIDLDSIMLIPAPGPDGTTGRYAKVRYTATATAFNTFDILIGGPDQLVGRYNMVDGGMPVVTPGTACRVNFLPAFDTVDDLDITSTTPVTWSYYPRYLYTRPASS